MVHSWAWALCGYAGALGAPDAELGNVAPLAAAVIAVTVGAPVAFDHLSGPRPVVIYTKKKRAEEPDPKWEILAHNKYHELRDGFEVVDF